MKKLFYFGLLGLFLFEIANVYFIMPIPGSQEMNSIGLAYFLHSWRWVFRVIFGIMMLAGIAKALRSSRWVPGILLLVVAAVVYFANFKMAADSMFYQPSALNVAGLSSNKVEDDRLVLGVVHNGEAKAYPIQYIGYHHQVRDSLGGKTVMVTYCTVCRTGRVFEPIVEGKLEEFRLVGMDHYNAMFEDKTTKSWWRQATGEAITGERKGQKLPELPSMQTTLLKWKELHPYTLVMQADEKFDKQYDHMDSYEKGGAKGRLTRRDSISWQPKSWVVGVSIAGHDKAYDWNRLQKERIIHDIVGEKPIAIILSSDNNSFIAVEREGKEQMFVLKNDSLTGNGNSYSFLGVSLDKSKQNLKKIPSYQEYWHSWKTFHPGTGH